MGKAERVKVWRLPVRLFHWGLAALFLLAFVTEDGSINVHAAAGYAAAGLVFFRLAWGFVDDGFGSIKAFLHKPADVMAHLSAMLTATHNRYLGHNPAAAAMAVALMALILATAGSGVLAYGAEEMAGPLGFLFSRGRGWEDELEDIHGFFANTTLAMAFIHLAGAALESVIHRENLVWSMITGYKTGFQKE
ncbi:MAG: cytochrome b/b6 domain-containing protein [Nitrospinae bacterium]|nr:cytochrome b/b6 domain-containing protein [Nitrospinota bacterium]